MRLRAWRAVEAQHVASTLRLTENDAGAQDLLERILEESKPVLPEEARGLHYLLATPFRYPPLPHGSRFRSAADPGVLYAAIEKQTACAEMGYWRWRFVRDSEGLREIAAAPQTLFQLGAAGDGIDLRLGMLARRSSTWMDRESYVATQALARAARGKAMALVIYASVRDPEHGPCVAVLDARALRPRKSLAMETWYLTVTAGGAVWRREGESMTFCYSGVF